MFFEVIFLVFFFILFAFSFYYPLFLLSLPFFLYKKINIQYPFKTGWLCGFIFFSIHMFGFLWVSFHNGSGFIRIVYPLLLFIYCGFYTGLWFYFLNKINCFSKWLKRGGWLFCTILYFWFVHTGIFWIFGSWQGYRLACPLVPVVNLFCVQKNKKKEFHQIVCLPLLKKNSPYEMAQNICLQLIDAQQKNKEAKIFALPESAFPFVLTEHAYALKMWHENVLHNDKYLILGSHSKNNGKLYNSFILVHSCRITQCYHKKHLVPFFEKVPEQFQSYLSFKGLFLSQKEQFNCGNFLPQNFSIQSFSFLPVICSELFFNDYNKEDQNIPLFSLMNDSYFKGSGYSKIMLNYAYYLAYIKKRKIIYVSSDIHQEI